MNTPAPSKCHAVIVAAGRGYRAVSSSTPENEAGPKQYQLLGDRAVLAHTCDAFLKHPMVDTVTVVIHEDDGDLYSNAMGPMLRHSKLQPAVNGGVTRQESVHNGLEAVVDLQFDDSGSKSKVLIHDAARPFVDAGTIKRVVDALETSQAALPALAIADTLKRSDDEGLVADTVDRTGLFAAQTPQGFQCDAIVSAHRDAALRSDISFTDDSALAEWASLPVTLVEGGTRNSKITTAEDLNDAKRTMIHPPPLPDIRVGHGYDTHQQVAGDHVWLCGLRIDHTHGLSGHSDADVGLHALTDALLSTIADGDIGSHFPPTDPQWKGARSDVFLNHAVSRVSQAGGTITHMDVTLICEAPKIGPHRDAMRQAISTISGIDVARIAVKATTNEKIGFVGRGEGIVALATATVVMGNL